MKESTLRKEKKDMKKKLLVIIAACVAIVLILFAVSASKCDKVNTALVGRTFKGYCNTSVFEHEYKIEFISETQCKVTHSEKWKEGTSTTKTETVTRPNVRYQVKGGLFGLTLAFDDLFADGAEPFQIEMNGDLITIFTTNFNSGRSMTLYEN